MGNYAVFLDGVEHVYNAGSDGSSRVLHEKVIILFTNRKFDLNISFRRYWSALSISSINVSLNAGQYYANNIGAQQHEVVITANPSGLGEPAWFELDAVSVTSNSGDTANSLGFSSGFSTSVVDPNQLSTWVFTISLRQVGHN